MGEERTDDGDRTLAKRGLGTDIAIGLTGLGAAVGPSLAEYTKHKLNKPQDPPKEQPPKEQ